MGKPLIIYRNVPAFKEWPTNFKLLFQAQFVQFQLGTLKLVKTLGIYYALIGNLISHNTQNHLMDAHSNGSISLLKTMSQLQYQRWLVLKLYVLALFKPRQ